MKQFNSLNELARAYAETYNASYSDPIKHFSAQDVIDVCITPLIPLDAKMKGITISRPTKQVKGFGYVGN